MHEFLQSYADADSPHTVAHELCPPRRFGNSAKSADLSIDPAAKCDNPFAAEQNQDGSGVNNGPDSREDSERGKIAYAVPVADPGEDGRMTEPQNRRKNEAGDGEP